MTPTSERTTVSSEAVLGGTVQSWAICARFRPADSVLVTWMVQGAAVRAGRAAGTIGGRFRLRFRRCAAGGGLR